MCFWGVFLSTGAPSPEDKSTSHAPPGRTTYAHRGSSPATACVLVASSSLSLGETRCNVSASQSLLLVNARTPFSKTSAHITVDSPRRISSSRDATRLRHRPVASSQNEPALPNCDAVKTRPSLPQTVVQWHGIWFVPVAPHEREGAMRAPSGKTTPPPSMPAVTSTSRVRSLSTGAQTRTSKTRTSSSARPRPRRRVYGVSVRRSSIILLHAGVMRTRRTLPAASRAASGAT